MGQFLWRAGDIRSTSQKNSMKKLFGKQVGRSVLPSFLIPAKLYTIAVLAELCKQNSLAALGKQVQSEHLRQEGIALVGGAVRSAVPHRSRSATVQFVIYNKLGCCWGLQRPSFSSTSSPTR